jgi:hypothetical protein
MFIKVGAAVKVIGSTSWIMKDFHSVSVLPWKENQEKSGKNTGKNAQPSATAACIIPFFGRVKPQTFLLEVPCSTFFEIS